MRLETEEDRGEILQQERGRFFSTNPVSRKRTSKLPSTAKLEILSSSRCQRSQARLRSHQRIPNRAGTRECQLSSKVVSEESSTTSPVLARLGRLLRLFRTRS